MCQMLNCEKIIFYRSLQYASFILMYCKDQLQLGLFVRTYSLQVQVILCQLFTKALVQNADCYFYTSKTYTL